MALILAKAFLFLAVALVIGQMLAPRISRLFAAINTGVGMKFTLAITTCLVFAFAAQQMDLAPIVGAFAAGLVLEEVHFRQYERPAFETEIAHAAESGGPEVRKRIDDVLARHGEKHLEHLIEPLGLFLVPFFFVITGMQVKLDLLADPPCAGDCPGADRCRGRRQGCRRPCRRQRQPMAGGLGNGAPR